MPDTRDFTNDDFELIEVGNEYDESEGLGHEPEYPLTEENCYSDENIRLGRYRHFKGKEYEVIGVATHSETMERMVIYRALYGEMGLWVRPLSMWNEFVDRDGKIQRRFTFIEK